MQIKVLVAEDEAPILRSICANIEKTNPNFTVIARAENGKRAIEALQSSNGIDVVFMDINMPVLNGIELLKYLREEHPEIFVVILSGYQDFSYAQAALKYGAVEYLLKPLKAVELKTTLQTIEQKITQRRQVRVAKLLQNPPFNDKRDLPNTKPAFVAAVTIGSYRMRTKATTVTNEHLETEKTLRHTLDECYGANNYILAESEQFNTKILMVDESVGAPWGPLAVFLGEQGTEIFSIPITVVAYPTCVKMQLVPQIHYMMRMLTFRDMLYDTCKFILFPVGVTVEDLQVIPKDYVSVFLCITAQFSREECLALYKNSLETLPKTRAHVLQMTKSFFSAVFSFPQRKSNYFMLEDEVALAVEQTHTKQTLFLYVDNILRENWGDNLETNFTKSDIAKSIQQYLVANLEQQVTLEQLEKKFAYTASYLREVFRLEYNASPLEYLLNERITRAKQLLSTGMSAKNVATAVGFLDPLYFSKVFKKQTGYTPSAFKDAIIKNE